MKAIMKALVVLLIAALFLSGCRLLNTDEVTPLPVAIQAPQETAAVATGVTTVATTNATAQLPAAPTPTITARVTTPAELPSPTPLPVILGPGSPPVDRCLVAHPGGAAVVDIYPGPSTAFAPIARLANWAAVLSGESGWVQIQVGPDQSGWIRETDVTFAGPCDHIDEPVYFELPADGSPYRNSHYILAGQADRYLFHGEAGSRLLIDLNSAGQVNFALLGVGSGQPLKRVENEDRTWEGTLPLTQEYMLTVVPGSRAADYELLVALQPAPPITVFYDLHTGAILGGLKDALWVDGDTAAASLLGGEGYGIYHLGLHLGQASGSAAAPIGGICPGFTVELAPEPSQPSALAVAGAAWEVAPQLVAPVELSQVERQAVAGLLAAQGLALDPADVQVQIAYGTDLDGDGFGEIIVLASRLKDGGRFPAVDGGDYVVAAVLMDIDGRLAAQPLVVDVYPQANDLAFPWQYDLSGALDLNGDGYLEVILAGSRWEGASTTVYSVGPAGGAAKIFERRCAE